MSFEDIEVARAVRAALEADEPEPEPEPEVVRMIEAQVAED